MSFCILWISSYLDYDYCYNMSVMKYAFCMKYLRLQKYQEKGVDNL